MTQLSHCLSLAPLCLPHFVGSVSKCVTSCSQSGCFGGVCMAGFCPQPQSQEEEFLLWGLVSERSSLDNVPTPEYYLAGVRILYLLLAEKED